MCSNELASTAKCTIRKCYNIFLALEHFLEVLLVTVHALEICRVFLHSPQILSFPQWFLNSWSSSVKKLMEYFVVTEFEMPAFSFSNSYYYSFSYIAKVSILVSVQASET